MMAGPILYVLVFIGITVMFGLMLAVIKMYKKAEQGQALVKTGIGGMEVSFFGMFVIPVLHNLERLDITVKSYKVSKRNGEFLQTKDDRKLEIEALFYFRVNQTEQDVKQVAQTFGSKDLSNPQFLERNFGHKFEEAILSLVYRSNLGDLLANMDEFKMEILNTIGTDLNGFILDDVAIHHLKELDEELNTRP